MRLNLVFIPVPVVKKFPISQLGSVSCVVDQEEI